jgi:hypothetical protein
LKSIIFFFFFFLQPTLKRNAICLMIHPLLPLPEDADLETKRNNGKMERPNRSEQETWVTLYREDLERGG